jgi:hypothetical protein
MEEIASRLKAAKSTATLPGKSVRVFVSRRSGPCTDLEASSEFVPGEIEVVQAVISLANAATNKKEGWYARVEENEEESPPGEAAEVTQTKVPSFWATIYVGLRVRYTSEQHSFAEAGRIVSRYCDVVGLGVTMTPTEFVYKNGKEPGIAVGLINYPRFPSSPDDIRRHACNLAKGLRLSLGQARVSVVFPDETIMFGEVD